MCESMLNILNEFRETLDELMLNAMHSRVILYGYGYTGRFLKWYAEYYHGIKVDYTITLDTRFGRAYDQELFQTSLFDFNYKDVSKAIVWLAEPMTDELNIVLKEKGYIKDKTYFDFYEVIYGTDIDWGAESSDVFRRKKSGIRDIQFLEWLEYKYDCNFLQVIEKKNFEVAGEHGASFRTATQKELFPILDKCHCIPGIHDAIFDYGCGKGGAMISFLDYGFCKVGGVEYEPQIYDILVHNMKNLKLENEGKVIECIQGNAAEVNEPLDKYNWFYFYQPFDDCIFRKCINSICNSIGRNKRKVRIIHIIPLSYECILESGYFRLINQFTIDTRQRVVNIYESYN